MAKTRKRNRRGVLILVVLSLLVLFVMVAVIFVITSNQAKLAAKASSQAARSGQRPRAQLDEAVHVLLRDTREEKSPFRGQSLLADMYGGSVRAELTADVVWPDSFQIGGQFVEISVAGASLNANKGYYDGCVLTFVSGPAKGASARIVTNHPESPASRLRLYNLKIDPEERLPRTGDRVVINGRPFTGNGTTAQPNESYDAPDERNMYLAAVIPPDANHAHVRIIPSFDRSQTGGPTLRSAALPAKLPWNPDTNPYPWDVDNDNDGIPDSIWVDLGFPIRSEADGRLVKTLFAFLCQDLDGRLNLNAHGSLVHVENAPAPVTMAGGTSSSTLPRGEGYGTAEIFLGGLLGGEYAALFRGGTVGGRYIPGRYGIDAGGTSWPGYSGIDALAQVRFFNFPTQFLGGARTSFATPPDLLGRNAFGLDWRGQPVYEGLSDAIVYTEYEMNLSQDAPRGVFNSAARDNLFSVAELERLLRVHDADAGGLPDRLWTLFAAFRSASAAAENRRLVTTDAYDLPVPSADIYEILFERGVAPNFLPALLSPDLAMGLRLDLNRPFGNGRDDNGNGTVDDDDEGNDDLMWRNVLLPGFPTAGVRPDRGNDGTAAASFGDAKQLYARHLYVLLMLLKSGEIDFDGDGQVGAPETARGIAQWAVNVVDFRDADSIMTRFAYDPSPFDGWNPNPVVWGCERPEMLMTEAVATHERRTEDLDNDLSPEGAANGKTTKDQGDVDGAPQMGEDDSVQEDGTIDPEKNDFDQRLRPRGSLFVELYNPWTGAEFHPGEFYRDHASGSWSQGLILNQRTPDGSSPVWRLIVVGGDSHINKKDPDDPSASDAFDPTDIERNIYFGDPGNVGSQGAVYYSDLGLDPLVPGRYAVVGSSGQRDGGKYVTRFGRRTDVVEVDGAMDFSTTRRIELTPGAGLGIHQIAVLNNGGPAAPEHKPAIAVPINKPSVSISEPPEGYPVAGWDPAAGGGEGAYEPPLDTPLDADNPELDVDGTIADYRTIHLQRLANPLKTWDAQFNPFRTVDTISVDLTVFNGVTSEDEPNRDDPTTIDFTTLQRGDAQPAFERNLWRHERAHVQADIAASPKEVTQVHYFDYVLQHSLGYLNERFQPGFIAADAPDASFIGDPNSMGGGKPFPWLCWNNRPYVSHFELMRVPRSRSSRLTYDVTLSGGDPDTDPPTPPFAQLINFYDDSLNSARLFRSLLEFVQVPSRFVGTERLLRPDYFDAGNNQGIAPFFVPFNKVSNYREPGKVNINTIYSKRIWDAIMHEVPGLVRHPGPSWAGIVTSRRGYGSGDDILETVGAQGNSFFEKPFQALHYDRGDTLLRDGGGTPLFGNPINPGPHNDIDRNPVFRQQSLQRMGNLLTTRSNTFAVWVTAGYFQVRGDGSLTELGSDAGDLQRHRAFYLIDRTIPVAFEPGENHNVDDAILLRRFIE